MSYDYSPHGEEIELVNDELRVAGGVTIKARMERNAHTCPTQVYEWLVYKCGWISSIVDPTTGEPLFASPDSYALDLMYHRWYEAVAYESYLFMTIGGKNS